MADQPPTPVQRGPLLRLIQVLDQVVAYLGADDPLSAALQSARDATAQRLLDQAEGH